MAIYIYIYIYIYPPTSLSVERVGPLLIIESISYHPITNHPIHSQPQDHPNPLACSPPASEH